MKLGSLKSPADLQPLYLLLGTEQYLRQIHAKKLIQIALSTESMPGFNEITVHLSSEPMKNAVIAANQLPMMADRRVVLVRDFARLRASDEEPLLDYLRNPMPSTVMIFLADDLDKRKKSAKAMMEACTVIEFPPLKDVEAKAWVKEYISGLKVSYDEPVLDAAISVVGTDVQTLASEFDKLATAAFETGRITMLLFEGLTDRSRELSNFDLTDQLLANDRERALETLQRLLEDRAEPVMLVGLIASNYHRLALGKALLAKGRDEVFRNIPMPPFKRTEFMATLQRNDAKKIARGIQLIAEVDLAIKTSQGTPRLQLEVLICELT